MRKVKLQDTGESSTNDVAYQAPDKKYYSSEDAYKKIVRNREYRQKCIEGMYALLGYKTYMKIPTIFFKKLKECEGYGYDVVYRCMQMKAKDIQWVINNKQFDAEIGKVMYVWAILENNMNYALKAVVAESRELERQLKSDESVNVDLDITDTKQHTVNISRFLED